MIRRMVPNRFENTTVAIALDDDIAEKLKDVEIVMNNFGYPTMLWDGRLQPVHRVVYWLRTGIWSERWKTGIHHKNHNKRDARFNNLELVDWQAHYKEHGWTHPAPTPATVKRMYI